MIIKNFNSHYKTLQLLQSLSIKKPFKSTEGANLRTVKRVQDAAVANAE